MDEIPPTKKKCYWIWWVGCAVFFLLCGIVWGAYWVFKGQYNESTDDSYVNGNMIMINPFEEGIIVSILADNAQMVEKGQPLLELDRHDFQIALDKAQAELGDAVRKTVQLFFRVEELEAKIEVAGARVSRAHLDYEHRAALVEEGGVSREDFEHSEIELVAATANLREIEKEWAEAEAQIINTTPFTHPHVEKSKAALRHAFLALHRCTVLAPTRGIITQRRAQVGQWVRKYEPLMALVPPDQIWVDANFREVSLKHLRVGQPVELTSDMYGSDVKFHGRIIGLNPGTGSVFSILPPQNATGNWIKIIQRVPVKIALNSEEVKTYPLVLGLTLLTKVDTHDRSGFRLPKIQPKGEIYATDAFTNELAGVEQMIQQIFIQNCSCAVETHVY